MTGYPFFGTDAGRGVSRRPRQKNDCTVRALATACGIAYDSAYDVIKARGRRSNRGAYFPSRAADDRAAGFSFTWQAFPAVKGQRRMNPVRFCRDHPGGAYIVKTARHVFAIVDGVAFDTSPSRPDRCIYGCWRVERAPQ